MNGNKNVQNNMCTIDSENNIPNLKTESTNR